MNAPRTTHTNIHTHTNIRTHTNIHTHKYTHTHTNIHTHKYIHTQTYIHTEGSPQGAPIPKGCNLSILVYTQYDLWVSEKYLAGIKNFSLSQKHTHSQPTGAKI